MRGDNLYLCAPRGQIVEGCLIVAPYQCVGCLARAPRAYLDELEEICHSVERFYAAVYGIRNFTSYEQGRAGGGLRSDPRDGFPHHAHVFCLPLALDLHCVFADEYARLDQAALSTVRVPYVYVDGIDGEARYRKRAVYIARSREGRNTLEGLRLKPTVARLVGKSERGDWRSYPGDHELERVIEQFNEYRKANGADYG
jgi:hypothetical protein